MYFNPPLMSPNNAHRESGEDVVMLAAFVSSSQSLLLPSARCGAPVMQAVEAPPQVASWYDAGLRLSPDSVVGSVVPVAKATNAAAAVLKEEGAKVVADREARMAHATQALKLLKLKEEGEAVVADREATQQALKLLKLKEEGEAVVARRAAIMAQQPAPINDFGGFGVPAGFYDGGIF